jgi:type II secretory pathway pseudopilin PulG
MSLVELMISLSLLGMVLGVIVSILFSVQSAFGRQQDRSNSNDQARLAVEELDREIRSGNLLYDPATYPSGGNGMQLVVYTQTNAPTRNPGNRCVHWRIINDQLQRRDWASTDPTGSVSDWRVVAENVVNNDTAKSGRASPVSAFVLDHTQSSFGDRIIKISILVNSNPKRGKTVQIDDSVTGRNTQFGYPSTVCNFVPPV